MQGEGKGGNAVPSDMAYVIASAIKEAYFNGR